MTLPSQHRFRHESLATRLHVRARLATAPLDAVVTAARSVTAPGLIVEVGTGHGLVAMDSERQIIRPAKLWNDTTTEPDCAWLTRKLGGLDAVLALTGNPFLPGYTAPKISWFHRSETEAYARSRACARTASSSSSTNCTPDSRAASPPAATAALIVAPPVARSRTDTRTSSCTT